MSQRDKLRDTFRLTEATHSDILDECKKKGNHDYRVRSTDFILQQWNRFYDYTTSLLPISSSNGKHSP